MKDINLDLATFGGGCFWCTESVFQQVKGVEKIVSGYTGGKVPGKPTYREVCSGLTGHAEVIQITFNPAVISYEDLVENPSAVVKEIANLLNLKLEQLDFIKGQKITLGESHLIGGNMDAFKKGGEEVVSE